RPVGRARASGWAFLPPGFKTSALVFGYLSGAGRCPARLPSPTKRGAGGARGAGHEPRARSCRRAGRPGSAPPCCSHPPARPHKHRSPSRHTEMVPGTLTAPGPGRSTVLSISGVPVAGMQKFPASVVEKSEPPPSRGEPVSRIVVAAVCPKAPGTFWPGQKKPVGLVRVDVPVLSGEREIGSSPMNCAGEGGHSRVVSFEPTPPEQDCPARAPA